MNLKCCSANIFQTIQPPAHPTCFAIARAKEFDAFLKRTSRQLYHDAGKQLKGVRWARLKGFRYIKPMSMRFAAFSKTRVGQAMLNNKHMSSLIHKTLVRFGPSRLQRKKNEGQQHG